MSRWSRDELEAAFANYQAVALAAGTSGDWNPWADLFTEDATYVEAHYGRFGGREAIRRWITTTMAEYPNNEMPHFPIDWYLIDEDRAWVVCKVWNRMQDPGDGSIHQEYNLTLLKYAGVGEVVLRRGHLQPGPLRHDDRRLPRAKEATGPRQLSSMVWFSRGSGTRVTANALWPDRSGPG